MDERHEISKAFDEYAQDLTENGGLTACDYESFEAGWKAARAQGGDAVAWLVDRPSPWKPKVFLSNSDALRFSDSRHDASKPLPLIRRQPADNNKKLQALRDSINGDCYMGEEWELKTIDEILNPPAEQEGKS